jgi:histone H3/H4
MENTHTNTNNAAADESTEGGEVLVVASKIKNYIRGKSGMNTSAAVMDALSGKIRNLCDQAIEQAKSDGRKTVMDRDFG